MIINKLSVKSFGKLKNINIDLSPGLNIIYGKNESGKSTLLGFIKGIFYGLNKKSNKDEISEYDRYKPWDSEEFTGMIDYNLNEKNYKVGRNFITNKVSLCNEFWDDISDKFPKDKKRGPLFAEEHLGLSEENFQKTIFVSQLDSRIKDNSKELVDKLINVQQTGSEDVSYTDAIKLLENTSKERIGSNKTKKKPLNMINEEISSLQKEKNEIAVLRNEVFSIEGKLKEIATKRNELIEKINYNKGLKDSQKRQRLLKKYNKAIEYETALEDVENQISRLSEYEKFPIELEKDFKEILIQLNNYSSILEEKNNELKKLESKISENETNLELKSNDEVIYKANINIDMLKSELREKNQLDEKISLLETEINKLRSELKEFEFDESISNEDKESLIINNKKLINIQNKIDNINQIRYKINNFDENTKDIQTYMVSDDNKKSSIFISDIQTVEENVDKISDYKTQINNIKIEIRKIEDNIKDAQNIDSSFKEFAEVPSEILDVMEKISQSSTGDLSGFDNIANLYLAKYKKKIFISIIFFALTLGFLGYSFYSILFSYNTSIYLPVLLGIVSCVLGIISFAEYSKDVHKRAVQINDDIQKFFESLKVTNNKELVDKFKKYKEAKAKILELESDLKHRNIDLEIMSNHHNKLVASIYEILDQLNIPYKNDEISINEIAELKKKFIDKSQNDNEQKNMNDNYSANQDKEELLAQLKKHTDSEALKIDDIDKILNKLEKEKQNSNSIINEIILKNKLDNHKDVLEKLRYNASLKNDIENKMNEFEHLNQELTKSNNKIKQIDDTLKSTLEIYSIKYDKENIFSELELNNIKNTLNNMLEDSKETTKIKVIIESINLEISRILENKNNLENEKAKMLEAAFVKDEKEFEAGFAKYIKLKELKDERSRLKNICNEILEGNNSGEILQKASSLPNVSIHNQDDISEEMVDKKLEELNGELKLIDEDMLNLRNKANNLLNGKMDLNEIDEKIGLLNQKKESLELKKQAIDVATEVINEVANQIQKDFSPKFQNEMSSIVDRITNGRYTQVRANGELNLNVLNPDFGQIISADKLSQGTIDQLYLGLRIALSNLLNKNNKKLPLIIDEAFVQYDDERVKNVLEFFIEESKERQVIIFTCQKREIEVIKDLKIDANTKIIELV